MFFLGRSKKAEKDGALAGELAEKNRRIDEEKNRLAAILESLVEGVVVVDTRQKINIANSAILRTLGCQKEKAEGRYYWEIFRDSDLNDMIRQALADEKPVAREHALLLSKKIFKIQVSPVRAGADFLGVAAIFHDITPLKELERARAEFVANVSHELKTPLTSILGSVETLKEGAAEDPVYRGKFLGIIENHSRDPRRRGGLSAGREQSHRQRGQVQPARRGNFYRSEPPRLG
ncbi:MAG: PAS domain S-box protein [Candidatus Omnitrophica bacterium]|nr:PAS domain S-box protein [Candidatus Omnitrophota bacterium]